MVTDSYGRPMTNLRIAVTQRCNFKCIYCHEEGDPRRGEAELTPEEIRRIVETASELGVKKVKITGGEPLLRKDLCEIVSGIREVHGIEEVSMSTNGSLLLDYAHALKDAGLKRVNVNLPSIKREVYQKVTGFSQLDKVKKGLFVAEKVGLTPVKINMVVLRSVNEGEIWDLVNFIEGRNFVLQLIELERLGNGVAFYEKYYADLQSIQEQLEARAAEVTVKSLHNRRVYRLKGGGAQVELVRPFHNSDFCMNCTRMRVTAGGELKPCLMRCDNYVNIASPLRRATSKEELKRIFLEAVKRREPYFGDGGCRKVS
jgi:cyclic pyranopterin phosphate synthase